MSDLIDRDKFIAYLDVGHLRSPTEICLSEQNVLEMIKAQPSVKANREIKAFERDMREYIENILTRKSGQYACYLCKRYEDPCTGRRYTSRKLKCPEGCDGYKHWVWRGLCKENGG